MANESKMLTYADLMQKLDIDNVRQLEDLIIEGIYNNLLGAKLDQKNQRVEVDFALGRDLKDGDLARMIDTLNSW